MARRSYLYALPAQPACLWCWFDSTFREVVPTDGLCSPWWFELVWDGDSAGKPVVVFFEYLLQQLSQGVALSSIGLPAGSVKQSALSHFIA